MITNKAVGIFILLVRAGEATMFRFLWKNIANFYVSLALHTVVRAKNPRNAIRVELDISVIYRIS